MKLSEIDKKRLYECAGCDYFDVCIESVPEPMDNPDGSCKTKDEFERIEREGRTS